MKNKTTWAGDWSTRDESKVTIARTIYMAEESHPPTFRQYLLGHFHSAGKQVASIWNTDGDHWCDSSLDLMSRARSKGSHDSWGAIKTSQDQSQPEGVVEPSPVVTD